MLFRSAYVDMPVTGIVQAWSRGAVNSGMAVKNTAGASITFYTSERSDATNRPQLHVTYVPLP